MRRSIVVAVGILVVAGGLFAAFAWMNNGQLMPRDLLSPAIARPGAATDAPQGAQDQRILADALIVPVQFAALSFPVDGRVSEVLVQEGDRVEQGQVLARLKSDYEVLLVAQAQAEVDRARAQVELLQRGARAEELAAAQAAIDAAQAQADILRQGPREEDVAAAEAAVAAAQAQYATVAASANEQDVVVARLDMEKAQTALDEARAAFSQVSLQADASTLPEASALQAATAEFETARSRYDALSGDAQSSRLWEAAALIDQARAQLERLQVPPTENEIAAAEATVRQAQAAYDLLAAGTRPEEIAMAQGELSAAETLLIQAQLALNERELLAPISGTVASLSLRPGQDVQASAPIAQIADQSSWLAQTTDLSEIAVVEVEVGDTVQVNVDAIPDIELGGHVVAVSQMGTNILGDVTYTVTVQLDDGDPRLRWNMTASVEID